MNRASVRFYAELNDFLAPERRMCSSEYRFYTEPSVKDVIEGLGVPHTEVDLVVVNGRSVDFSCLVKDGDRVSVYPVFESIDITPVVKVRPEPLREPRFVLDTHLGRLASYLRMFGFDAVYRNDCDDAELARISSRQHRILLTRDRGLLKRSAVTHGHYVRETNVRRQLIAVLRRFDLFGSVKPFLRCLKCNGLPRQVDKASVSGRLPPKTRELHEDFQLCPGCDRVYWRGSHYHRMSQFMEQILNQARPASGTASRES